jgi:hypothetical protein
MSHTSTEKKATEIVVEEEEEEALTGSILHFALQQGKSVNVEFGPSSLQRSAEIVRKRLAQLSASALTESGQSQPPTSGEFFSVDIGDGKQVNIPIMDIKEVPEDAWN